MGSSQVPLRVSCFARGMSKNSILLSLLFLACRHETAVVSPPAPIVVEASVPDAGRAFGPLMKSLSEPPQSFLSDNWISNETSYLQTKNDLHTGGAYIGVGPEQNFSY